MDNRLRETGSLCLRDTADDLCWMLRSLGPQRTLHHSSTWFWYTWFWYLQNSPSVTTIHCLYHAKRKPCDQGPDVLSCSEGQSCCDFLSRKLLEIENTVSSDLPASYQRSVWKPQYGQPSCCFRATYALSACSPDLSLIGNSFPFSKCSSIYRIQVGCTSQVN